MKLSTYIMVIASLIMIIIIGSHEFNFIDFKDYPIIKTLLSTFVVLYFILAFFYTAQFFYKHIEKSFRIKININRIL
jgi:hypothetical protein